MPSTAAEYMHQRVTGRVRDLVRETDAEIRAALRESERGWQVAEGAA